MHETDSSGATLVNYTHEPAPNGPLFSEHRSGTEYYHHYDALGSTTMLTNDAGAITDSFQYDAWGNSISRTGTTATPYQWAGRWGNQIDAPSGDFYGGPRAYQPNIARWTGTDPLTIVPSTGCYSYLNNIPTTSAQVGTATFLAAGKQDDQLHFFDEGAFLWWNCQR